MVRPYPPLHEKVALVNAILTCADCAWEIKLPDLIAWRHMQYSNALTVMKVAICPHIPEVTLFVPQNGAGPSTGVSSTEMLKFK